MSNADSILNNSTFFDYKKIWPSLQLLKDNFPSIKKEYEDFKNIIQWMPMHWDLGYDGKKTINDYYGWRASPILGTSFSNNKRDLVEFEICKHFPILTNLLKQINITHRVGFTSLDPNSDIVWHRDYDDPNTDTHTIVRVLFAVDVPKHENKSAFLEIQTPDSKIDRHTFNESDICAFWSLSYHRAVNQLPVERTLIGMDLYFEKDWLVQNI